MYTLYFLIRHNLILYMHNIVLRTAFIFATGGILITYLLANTVIHEYGSFITHFGLLIMELCISFMTIYNASHIIYSDLIYHTIENIISAGVSRFEYLFGKYCALLLVNLFNLLVMSLIITILLLFKGELSEPYFFAIYAISIELVFLSSVAIFLNVISSNIVTFYSAAAIYITGHYTDILMNLSKVTSSTILQYYNMRVKYYII